MKIVHITAGAGGMFCGGCFRDNALVAMLRKQGHSALLVPVYLPLTLEEADQSAGVPIFFGGISVYLEQKLPLFARAPRWIHSMLASRPLLQWASGRAAKTRPEELGDLTLSMLQGEEGRQARELEVLAGWIETTEKPDVICLSNALLVGMARRLKARLRVPVVCTFQGEDGFLNSLPEPFRTRSWSLLRERAADLDCFIAPSRYFRGVMQRQLDLPDARCPVLFNGINLEGYQPAPRAAKPPVLGYFARMCREKGVETVVEAFLALRRRRGPGHLHLHIGGGMGPSDRPVVAALQKKIRSAGALEEVRFFPNLDRAGKLAFFQELTLFSTPALFGEAFGLYVVEAMASGIPVVQPHHAAFPELIEATGGGLTFDPASGPEGLASALERLLAAPEEQRRLARQAYEGAHALFSMERMAAGLVSLYEQLIPGKSARPAQAATAS